MAQAPQAPQAPLTVRLAGAVQAGDAVLLLAATVLAAVDTAAGKSYQVAGGRLEWGIPALLLPAAGFAALFGPASLRALTRGRPADRD